MEFPPDWDVSPMEDFEAYMPPVQSSASDYVMELLAQLQPSGQILDHFRIALDGSAALSKELDLGQLIPSTVFKGHKLAFQFWPRDPPEHGVLRVGGRPGAGLRQRGSGPGPPGGRDLTGQLHEDAGGPAGRRTGVLLPALGRYRRRGRGYAASTTEPALRRRKPFRQACNKRVSSL
jgi:hypothetical protein